MANKKALWIIGLLIVLTASLLNGLLIHFQISGLIRELMRLLILFGIGIFVFGLFKRKPS